MIPAISILAAVVTPLVAQPSMSSLWPNQDGLRWEYRQSYELAAWMPGGADTSQVTVGLRFDGTVVVPGGLEVQNLVEEEPAAAGAAGCPDHAWLGTLWLARPELRESLEQQGVFGPAAQDVGWAALLIHGGAYEKTAGEIITWRDNAVDVKSWKFLESDLTPGSTFTLQLVPDLAPDVFLHGTVGQAEEATVPAGTYAGSIRVTYRIDYGQAICTNEGGGEIGSFRALTDGHVLYAPGIGPVQSVEELTYTEVTGDCPNIVPGEIAQRVRLELTVPPVRSEPVTWGGVKARHSH